MPQAQTVELPKRLPLVALPSNRDATTDKDSKLVNCYAEQDSEGTWQVEKRFGTIVQSPAVNGELGRGFLPSGQPQTVPGGQPRVQPDLYTDAGGGQIHVWSYISFPFQVWQITRTIQGGPATTVSYGIVPATPSRGQIVVFGWGTVAYTIGAISGAPYSPITDPNYPIQTVPGFVYLDGTMYVMNQFGEIFGSLNLNDPTVWDPLNVIFAEARPDTAVALAQQLTYVVAIKSTSTQFFYDAGNPTGSPLSPVPGALVEYGCISADTVQSIDDLLCWVTSNIDATPQVLILQNLQPSIISTSAVERLIENCNFQDQWMSFSFKLAGHKFYGFTNIQANITMVYDLTSKLWSQWTDADGNYFQVISTQNSTPFTVANPTVEPARLCVQMRNDGRSYFMYPDYVVSNDNGAIIQVKIVTPNFDAGTDRGKMMNVMYLSADQKRGSEVDCRFSDDDYINWSNARTFDLGVRRPMLTDWGTFTKRAFEFTHQCDTPLRIRAVGIGMDLCTL
jgi:hypothetical protein